MQMEKVDWFFIITDLQKQGVHPAIIAKRIGHVTRMAVQNWKNNGSEPNHCNGEALLKIWRTVTGKDEPPMKTK